MPVLMWLTSVVWEAKTVRMVRPAIGDETAVYINRYNKNMTMSCMFE